MGDLEPSQVGIVLQYQESTALYEAGTSPRPPSMEQLQNLAQPSKEIISLENEIRAIDPGVRFQRERKILRPSRPGTGFDGMIYGEILCTVLIPLAAAAVPIVVPLVKAWLERTGRKRVKIKIKDGTIREVDTQGLTTDEVLRLLHHGQDVIKRNKKQESKSLPQVKTKPRSHRKLKTKEDEGDVP
jgi:hypothetical protein